MRREIQSANIIIFVIKGGGAWIVSHQAEQRRRFKAVLCANPLTYEQLKEQRRRSEKGSRGPQTQTFIIPPPSLDEEDLEDEDKILDGFFLVKIRLISKFANFWSSECMRFLSS